MEKWKKTGISIKVNLVEGLCDKDKEMFYIYVQILRNDCLELFKSVTLQL